MNIFDIVVFIIFLIAVFNGWRRGFAVQAFGLIAIILGLIAAARSGADVGAHLSIDPHYATICGFLIVFLCVVGVLLLAGRLLRRIFKFAGLGFFDVLLGIVLSVVKVALLLGVLCVIFDKFNAGAHIVPRESLESSITYRPLCNTVSALGGVGKSLGDGTEKVVGTTLDNI